MNKFVIILLYKYEVINHFPPEKLPMKCKIKIVKIKKIISLLLEQVFHKDHSDIVFVINNQLMLVLNYHNHPQLLGIYLLIE